jgi:hypothetical protein
MDLSCFKQDWTYCGYSLSRDGCTNVSEAFLASDYRAKYAALAGTASTLNGAGMWPIFSTKNYLNASYSGLTPGLRPTCVIALDEYVEVMKRNSEYMCACCSSLQQRRKTGALCAHRPCFAWLLLLYPKFIASP